MKTYIAIVLLLLCAMPVARAELKSKPVVYHQGKAVLEGYLVYDDQFKGKRPGVLVVHEWKGLNDYVQKRADMLAKMGYVAFAPDIYGKGIRPNTVAWAGQEAGKYKDNRPLFRLRVLAGFDVLRRQKNVDVDRLAAIGYCFGGTAVLELARAGADVKGVVSFHGGLNSPTPQDANYIRGKVLVLHGEQDPFVPPDEVAGFEKEMKEASVDYQLISYPGAVHGFTNPANTGEIKGALYNREADLKSWAEMERFLAHIFK